LDDDDDEDDEDGHDLDVNLDGKVKNEVFISNKEEAIL
jgi:hypothetical protein